MTNLPAPTDTLSDTLQACLAEASTGLEKCRSSSSADRAHVQWLERQLAHLISQLQALLVDVETGNGLGTGVFSEAETLEMLEDSMTEIRNLKSLIQTLRAMCR